VDFTIQESRFQDINILKFAHGKPRNLQPCVMSLEKTYIYTSKLPNNGSMVAKDPIHQRDESKFLAAKIHSLTFFLT